MAVIVHGTAYGLSGSATLPTALKGAVHLTDRRIKMAETKKTEKKIIKKKNPWKEGYMLVYIPKKGDQDEDYQFVSINGRTFQIEKNRDVAVPRPVAMLLKQRDSSIKVAERAIKKAQDDFLHPPVL